MWRLNKFWKGQPLEVRGADGEVSDFIATATDITERKRVETCSEVTAIDLSVVAARAARNHGSVVGPCTDLELVLAEGEPLEVRCLAGDEPVPARVWLWSSAQETWSWGGITDPAGRLRTRVSPEHDVVAEPLAPERGVLSSGRRNHRGEALELSWSTDA